MPASKGRRGGIGFGAGVVPILLLVALLWLGFCALDWALTGDPAYTIWLAPLAAPLAVPAGFAAAYPLVLLGTAAMGKAPVAARRRHPALAFWLLVFGWGSLLALALFLANVAEIDLTARDLCQFEAQVPGQSAGLVLAAGETPRDWCRLNPMAVLLILPLPLAAVMLAALGIAALRLYRRQTECRPLRRPGLAGGVAVPLLACSYLAAIAALALQGIVSGLVLDRLSAAMSILYGAPLLALLVLPAALGIYRFAGRWQRGSSAT